MKLRDQLIRDEGLRLEPYRDSEGLLTIGVGHCLDRKGISRKVADLMLDEDISDAQVTVRTKWPWVGQLSEARQAAFTNLVFNLGGGGLSTFKKFLAAAQAGDWVTASRELLNSKYAKQVGGRAQRVAQQLLGDTWV